ncbi:hypothetical protein DQE80_15760, partial [Enterococcus sp. HPCN18]
GVEAAPGIAVGAQPDLQALRAERRGQCRATEQQAVLATQPDEVVHVVDGVHHQRQPGAGGAPHQAEKAALQGAVAAQPTRNPHRQPF